MSQTNQDIATILRDNGLSVTKQRLMVFELLENRDPVTMYDLYDLCKGKIDRASLYRIINAYEKLSIVQRINIGWKYKIELSDKFSEHHHHLTCLNCQRIIPINEDVLEKFINDLGENYKFNAIEHQVEVQGYCDACS